MLDLYKSFGSACSGSFEFFLCYVLDKAQQVLCKNVGCNAVFKWRMEHHQHMKTCPHQKPNKGYIIKDGKDIYGKCSKHIEHQSNIPRHLEKCKQKVKNTSYNCTFCEKTFKFPCRLKEHLTFHAKPTEKTCPNCKEVFKRIDHYRTHRITCEEDRVSTDQFLPSFASSFSSQTVPNASESSSVQEEEMIATITEEIENDEQVVPEFTDQPTPEFSDLNIDVCYSNWQYTRQERLANTEANPKKGMIKNVADKYSDTVDEILAYTHAEDLFEARMCEALLNDLRSLHNSQKYGVFHARLHTLFREQLEKENFLRWLASKLNIRQSRFIDSVDNWKLNKYKERRGRDGIPFEVQKIIYDTWIENCTTSTDGRNGRNMVQISKRKYIEKYGSLSHESIKIDEHKNKRGQLCLASYRMVVTCPVRSIQGKVAEKSYTVSLGKVLSLQPFFVTYPTEKELSFCLCKLCLNSKLLFEPILVQAKKDGDGISKSLTEFFMSSCSCPKAVNGFYQWKCVTLKCKECKDAKPQSLSCQENDTLVKISQYEKVTSEYANKKKETKKLNKTERV